MRHLPLAAILLVAASTSIAGINFDKDIPGGADHPMLHRYEGSSLYMVGGENLGQAKLVQLDQTKPTLHTVEGRISNRFYWGPKGRSPLEVHRNFQQALTAAGFQTLFVCETEQCEKQKVQNLVQELPREVNWKSFNPMVANIFNSANQPQFHYISASKQMPAGPMYVQVAVVGGGEEGRVRQFIQIIEPTRMDTGKVTVDTRAIQDGLQRDGKIALYGVTFDTNKAVIREQSTEQLEQMAQALKAKPQQKVFIVGHTDDQGEFEANMSLSQKRAQAVAEALSSKYGIAASRLTARGVANLAPVASNASEEGRAKNRRVELVAR
ncbi:OmpA family protein [Pseudoduganella sp. RAF53_2]|uniref:OmpA family protein n=1 Tax=unclassified Pseudoduganella TaxID=2637179 RepID=UPI003F973F77